MRTIVRCAILAPALALGLPSARAAGAAEEKAAPAAPLPSDLAPIPTPAPPTKPIPPFLSWTKSAAPPPASSAPSAATGSANAKDMAKKAAANPDFSSAIQRAFPYAPTSAPAAEETQGDDAQPVVDMKPFHVTTDRIVERATKGMEERRQKLHDELFNAKDGGRFGKIGPAEIGLKFDPKHKGWDLLSIPW